MEQEEIVELESNIVECIKERNVKSLRTIFEDYLIQDIAEAMDDIKEPNELLFVFRVVSSDYTADLFAELTDEQQELIINSFTDTQLLQLIENSSNDDIVDSLEDMPANLVSRVLKVANPDQRKEINKLLNYKEDTAGSIMTTEFLTFLDTDKVGDTLNAIREKGKDAETIYTVFVKNNKRSLVGTIELDDLVFAKDGQSLSDIMKVEFASVTVDEDQEEIAKLFKRYDLNAMPVTNKTGKLIGIITVDDIVDVMSEEAAEDITNLSGVGNVEDTYLETPVLKLALKCVPWIVILMVLQVFTSLILSGFQAEIAKFAVLSVFSPTIMDAAGNSGGQTTGLMIRSLTLDEFKRGDGKKVVWKEFRVACLVAGMVAIFAFCWLMFEMSVGIVKCDPNMFPSITITDANLLHVIVALLVASTLFLSVIVAKISGVLLCFLAKKLKRDPAVMATPLITTIVDIVSLVSYFLLWTLVFGKIVGLA